jgi:hypothetical protein
MLLEVHQDVYERVTYRAWRGESPRVVSVVPDPPSAAEDAVHRPGETDGEAANAARECARMLRFRDEMDVIVLNREFDDSEFGPRGRGERATHAREHAARAEAAQCGHRS